VIIDHLLTEANYLHQAKTD